MTLNQSRRSKLALITGAAAALLSAAAMIGGTGLAAASTRPAISGIERFQVMSTAATAAKSSLIASGVFTAGGVSTGGNGATGTATVRLPGGTFKITHRTVRSRGTFNPRTCLFTVHGSGTYQLGGGTGKYAKISGAGKFVLTIVAVDARSKGACTQTLPPTAFQRVITLAGPVKA